MNADNERCNRTIQEALIDHEQDMPCDDLATFNDRLLDSQRHHHRLDTLTPWRMLAKSWLHSSLCDGPYIVWQFTLIQVQ